MGTTWSVKLVLPSPGILKTVRRGIEAVLDRIIAQMSTWEAESDISRFNRARPGTWHCLPDDFMTVLDCALTIAERTQGAYDPTLGALTALWGFGPEGPRRTPPPAQAVADARRRGGWRRLPVDRDSRRVMQPGGMRLDLSSIAKGYAVDRVAGYLEARGIGNHLVEIGGELRGAGAKPDALPWWVALDRPATHTVVALHGLSVATSGDGQRFFEDGGRRYSHIIDPRSGFPVRNGVTAATVLHRECMWADGLATALAVLGPEPGIARADADGNAAAITTGVAGMAAERVSLRFRAMCR